MRQKIKKISKHKFGAFKIPYGIPTVGQLPMQLTKATYQRPRTKSASKGHAPNQLPKATYPIRLGFRSSHYRCAPSELSPPGRHIPATVSYPLTRPPIRTSFGLSQVGPRKETPETIQGKPRPYVSLGGP